jgi:hypothetical protein
VVVVVDPVAQTGVSDLVPPFELVGTDDLLRGVGVAWDDASSKDDR